MADATDFQKLGIFYLGRPNQPVIKTTGGLVPKGDTTFTFSSPLLDEAGAVITEAIWLGIKIVDTGYIMGVYIPANGLDSTGTIATGCITGLKTGGIDVDASNQPTGLAANQVDVPDGSIVGVPYSTFQEELMAQSLLGTIGSAIKHNKRETYSGTNAIGSRRVFADATARDAAITTPVNGDECYLTSPGTGQVYVAGAWTNDNAGGVNNASTDEAGKIEMPTDAEAFAGTDIGGTGAEMAIQPSQAAQAIQDSKYNFFADAEASDTYVITPTPAISAYATGQKFLFTANTANTAAATLNVNAQGAKTIKKFNDQDLETGDIESGQAVLVMYDGTNMQMLSPVASQMSTANSATLTDGSNANSLHIHEDLLSSGSSNITIGNTTIETDLIAAVSVPANTLKTNGIIDFEIYVTSYGTTNTSGSASVRLKYGTTTIATLTIPATDAGTLSDGAGIIKGYLRADGDTAVQAGQVMCSIGGDTNLSTSNFNVHAVSTLGSGAEDSTGALNLNVTFQWAAANASHTITANGRFSMINRKA